MQIGGNKERQKQKQKHNTETRILPGVAERLWTAPSNLREKMSEEKTSTREQRSLALRENL
jgi:hypothetical protein